MTQFRKALSASIIAIGLTLSACSPEKTIKKVEKEENSVINTETSTDATPVSAPADDPQATNSHEGHGHEDGYGSGTDGAEAPAIEIDHVFDFAPDDHLVGSDAAPIKMIVYASVTCGHCGGWFTNEYPILKKDYIDTGKVQMAFREIPTPPQQVSVLGFVVANCAPQDKYMDHIVHQMQNQEATFKALEDGKAQEVVDGWTEMAGLKNKAEVDACFNEKAHIDRINRSSMRMTQAGMQGVPGIVINGEIFTENDKSIANMAGKLSSVSK